MTTDTADIQTLRKDVRCVPMRNCTGSWRQTLHTVMAGMVGAGRPEFFFAVADEVAGNVAVVSEESKAEAGHFNTYIDAMIDMIERKGGDTYDAIGVAQEAGLLLGQSGRLPPLGDLDYVIGNVARLKAIGIAKPVHEWTETPEAFALRVEREDAAIAQRAEARRQRGEHARVEIHMPHTRGYRIHHEVMKLRVDVPHGFETHFSRKTNWLQGPDDALARLNAALAEIDHDPATGAQRTFNMPPAP